MIIRKYIKFSIFTSVAAGIVFLFAAMAYIFFPTTSLMPLPDNLRAQHDVLTNDFLSESKYSSDYLKLNNVFESQIYRSYCGVASSVIILNALGKSVSQDSFFSNENASAQRSFLKVFFTGIPLADLANLLTAYGVQANVYYASDMDENKFRNILKNNMKNPGDFLLVNYLRSVLGQEKVGHISPIGAYNPDTDEVLIMDVTTYNYPYVWVKLTLLFDAMNTKDENHTRGLVEVF